MTRGWIPAVVSIVVLGCSNDPPGPTQIMVIDHLQWTELDAASDPFTDRPVTVDCDPAAWGPEDFGGVLSLGVETGPCSYITASTPLTVEIENGAPVEMRIWHFDLTSPNGGTAHVAVHLNGSTIWEDTVDIPADSALLVGDWVADTTVPAGTPILFHIHNHGSNSWSLIELTATQ